MKHWHFIKRTMTPSEHSHPNGIVYHEHKNEDLVGFGISERELKASWRVKSAFRINR